MVTGGAGFIGSHLVDRIARDEPRELVVVDDLSLGKESNLGDAARTFPRLRFYRQDASDYDAMRTIVTDDRIEVLFNLAVVPLPASLSLPRQTVDINMRLAVVACELLRERYYRTLVHVSSSEAFGSARYVPMDEEHPTAPLTPYAASKLAGDHLVLSYRSTFGIDAAIVRPFNNYGPRQNSGQYAGVVPSVILQLLRREPITIHGDGEQTRDFIFVRDTADATVRAYEEPATRGQVLNVASGEELSINSLVKTILEIVPSDVPVRHDSSRPADVRRHWASIRLAQGLLGFRSRVSLHDGLTETVAWYRRNLHG